MEEEVKWIKIKVGMFDGESFKRIKRAKIGGEKFRDKLTAVWFELLDLSGKCNNNGFLVNNEIAYKSYEDIAIMLDRDDEEIELCMQFYLANGMIEIIDDCYCLSNWCKYQNVDGLEKIREKTRLRVQKYRENQKLLLENNDVTLRNVTQRYNETLPSQDLYNSISYNSNFNNIIKEENNINNIYKEEETITKSKSKRFVKPTIEEVKDYCLNERHNNVDWQKFYDYYESNGWKVGKNPMKDWKASVRTWERNTNPNQPKKEDWSDVTKAIRETKGDYKYSDMDENNFNF